MTDKKPIKSTQNSLEITQKASHNQRSCEQQLASLVRLLARQAAEEDYALWQKEQTCTSR
jgi:hypothetical protein